MDYSPAANRRETLLEVLQFLTRAIELLDEANAPGQIAAHVDLALHQLRDLVGGAPSPWELGGDEG